MLLTQTTYVTDIRLVTESRSSCCRPTLSGRGSIIDIIFGPWPTWFLAQTLIDWNFMWNNLAVPSKVAYQNCPPPCRSGCRTAAVAGQQSATAAPACRFPTGQSMSARR